MSDDLKMARMENKMNVLKVLILVFNNVCVGTVALAVTPTDVWSFITNIFIPSVRKQVFALVWVFELAYFVFLDSQDRNESIIAEAPRVTVIPP